MGRNRWGIACGLAAATLGMSSAAAQAAVPHVVQPGETLWSISAASNFTTRTVAAFNGLPEHATVVAGSTIQIPSVEEGAAALAEAALVAGQPSAPAPAAQPAPASPPGDPPPPAPGSTYGLAHVPSPYGELHLDPAAAASWMAMREEALATYGVELHPDGPVSAFRTYEQQAYLYDLFASGQGAPANPPGTSPHELGIAVDLATSEMRSVIDQIGPAYGWQATIPGEWWHVEYTGM